MFPRAKDVKRLVIGEAADRYELSPSVVVIWAQRWEETGSVPAMPSGGCTSPLGEHAEFLLGLIVEQPDLTLDEIVAAMRKKRIPGSRSAVWRFFERRNISFKKTLYAAEQKRRSGIRTAQWCCWFCRRRIIFGSAEIAGQFARHLGAADR
jgi:transposase